MSDNPIETLLEHARREHNGTDLHRISDEAEAELEALREASAGMAMALETACIAACNCYTKTPDPEYHAESCDYKRYRVALIKYRALDAAKTQC